MCLASLRKHCAEEDFTATTKWRRRCISCSTTSKHFFSAGKQKLVERCGKYIANDGDYMGK
jgi:hypothetical protein